MPKKSMDTLTESMFYVLMALMTGPMCGIDIAAFIDRRTNGRLQMGPATLYTILGKFEKEGYIQEVSVEGRKRTYAITDKGREAYQTEQARLWHCIHDAKRLETEEGRAWLREKEPEPSIDLRPALSTT